MPVVVQVAVGVITLAIVLLVAFLIPTLRQVRETTKELEGLIRVLQTELQPALLDLRETLRHLNRISGEVSDSISKVGGTVDAVQRTGQTIRLATEVIQMALLPRLFTTTAFMKGVKVGAKVFWRMLLKRR